MGCSFIWKTFSVPCKWTVSKKDSVNIRRLRSTERSVELDCGIERFKEETYCCGKTHSWQSYTLRLFEMSRWTKEHSSAELSLDLAPNWLGPCPAAMRVTFMWPLFMWWLVLRSRGSAITQADDTSASRHNLCPVNSSMVLLYSVRRHVFKTTNTF